MMESKIIKAPNTCIVYHRVTHLTDPEETRAGIQQALATLQEAHERYSHFALLLDMGAYQMTHTALHKMWASEFKQHQLVKHYAQRVAIVGRDSDTLRAEQALMESDRLTFFTDTQSALRWLGAE